MENTYNALRVLANLYTGEQTAKVFASSYQNSGDEAEKGIITASAFCKVYKFMYGICEKYYYLTSTDKASFSLEEVSKVLENYDCTKDVALTTVISTYLHNRLRMETEALNYDKRKINNDNLCESYQAGCEIVQGFAESGYQHAEFIDLLEASSELTESELKYCKLVIEESVKLRDCEIAKELGVPNQSVTRIKNSLFYKLPNILADAI